MLGLIVGYLFLTVPDGSLSGDEYYHSEAFAGAGRVTQEFLDAGLPAVAERGPPAAVRSSVAERVVRHIAH